MLGHESYDDAMAVVADEVDLLAGMYEPSDADGELYVRSDPIAAGSFADLERPESRLSAIVSVLRFEDGDVAAVPVEDGAVRGLSLLFDVDAIDDDGLPTTVDGMVDSLYDDAVHERERTFMERLGRSFYPEDVSRSYAIDGDEGSFGLQLVGTEQSDYLLVEPVTDQGYEETIDEGRRIAAYLDACGHDGQDVMEL